MKIFLSRIFLLTACKQENAGQENVLLMSGYEIFH
jgi:hypothetical protein